MKLFRKERIFAKFQERVAYIMELKYTNSFKIDLQVDLDMTRCVSVQFLDSLLTQ
ncbi:unnamed protein product, partial [Gongylonema pulchrum]|uniref:FERM domain-containing protein n=1 Tax=Gongylonema pulchrum TaxID=637853 RepID=A0A183DGD4_9BILA